MPLKKAASLTIKDVARKAGVSLGTASRVLNRQNMVGDDMRIRVERAIVDLGFRPNAIAQGMRRGVTHTVGIMVRDITVPVLAKFVKSAQDVFHESDYALLVASSENQKEREASLINAFTRRRVDGLITTTSSDTTPALLNACTSLKIPVVLFDRQQPDNFDAVLIDHRDGVRRAVDYLLDLGHLRIALLTGPKTVRPAAERIQGYKAAMRARGLSIDPSLLSAKSFADQSAYLESCALLTQKRPPTAIVAGGIAMLGSILRAVRSNGVRIPQELSVIASSDSDLAELATPPITTLRWEYAEMGRTAAQLLLDRIVGVSDRPSRRVSFPTDLVLRESCGPPPRVLDAREPG